MKFPSPFTILFVFVILQETLNLAMADQKFIEDTCKNTPDYDLCMSILLADPRSKDGDITALSLIGVAAIKNKGVQIMKNVEDLKKSQPELGDALDYCKKMYHAVVKVDVPLANQALRLGQPKFAEDGVADSAVESQACESTFGQHGQQSPMTDMNNSMNILANVVRALVRNLL
uniref:cell wall / vacuolar inhibitor of fructosidase 1-like n=1 Tax=Erigeron canadensis TaxID=72917 RepID=UPI001CB90676|nr:cell wall / vacuolar inhibitor of fructosidase 1-like [Erigeron canadensis]